MNLQYLVVIIHLLFQTNCNSWLLFFFNRGYKNIILPLNLPSNGFELWTSVVGSNKQFNVHQSLWLNSIVVWAWRENSVSILIFKMSFDFRQQKNNHLMSSAERRRKTQKCKFYLSRFYVKHPIFKTRMH